MITEYAVAIAAATGVAVGLVGGVFLEKLLKNMKDSRVLKCSEMLEKIYGEPMFANKFTFDEAREWLLLRQTKIKDGFKGIIMKVNKNTFEKTGSRIEVDRAVDNYLLLGIHKDRVFSESLLVKYISLDEKLNEVLKDGVMEVEL